jgi:hypothetical protein
MKIPDKSPAKTTMQTTMILADFAQVIGGKLYIMGGGWSVTSPQTPLSAIAIKVEVPWTHSNQDHEFRLELLEDGHQPVLVQTPEGNTQVLLGGKFQVGRPAGIPQGTPLDVPLAANIPPLPLKPGTRYVWKLSIDNEETTRVAFWTIPSGIVNR